MTSARVADDLRAMLLVRLASLGDIQPMPKLPRQGAELSVQLIDTLFKHRGHAQARKWPSGLRVNRAWMEGK